MKSQWSKWLPYPSSWLRAFVVVNSFKFLLPKTVPNIFINISLSGILLFSIAICWLIHLPIVAYYHHVFTLILSRLKTWYPIWLFGYAKIQQRLVAVRIRSPWPGLTSWQEGLNALIVLLITFPIGVIIYIPLYMQYLSLEKLRSDPIYATTICVIVAAYLYQYDFCVRQHRATRKAAQENKRKQPPVDPIDIEIDQLRIRMGMYQVKRKANKPRSFL